MDYLRSLSLLFLSIFSLFLTKSYSQQNSLLWEISGNGLEKPSFLLGTMHVKDKRAFQFHDSLLLKLKSCQTFAGEIVLDKQEAKGMAADLLLPKGKEMKTLLSKSEYKKIKKYCSKNLGAMAILINRIKPVFTSALVSESLLSNDMPKALDEYLQEIASKNNLEIKGLETIKEQMSVLDELSIEDQAKMLLSQIENIEDERKEIQRMADVYASQNLDSIITFLQTPELEGEFGDALIKDRNSNMADRLSKLLATETVFCAIGAAHLPGDFGVINLLKIKGFTLRPIKKEY